MPLPDGAVRGASPERAAATTALAARLHSVWDELYDETDPDQVALNAELARIRQALTERPA